MHNHWHPAPFLRNLTRPNMCTMSASKPHLCWNMWNMLAQSSFLSSYLLILAPLDALASCSSFLPFLAPIIVAQGTTGCRNIGAIRGPSCSSLASLGLLHALLASLCIIQNQIRSLFSFPCPLPRKKHRWLEETWPPPKRDASEVVPDLGKLK